MTGARRLWPRRALGWLWPAGLFSLALTAGCADDQRVAGGDPLLGGGTPVAANPAAAPPRPSTAPPFQPTASQTSNAALASTTAPAFDPGHDLRIGGPASGPAPYSGQYSPAPPAGAALSQPQPVFQPAAQHDALLSRAFGRSPSSQTESYEQLKAQLGARGVTYQRLETWDGGWKFTCSVPSPQNAYISRTYEAQAHDDLAAMRAVLDQIDKEK